MLARGDYEVRDYGFADQALALRKRAGLTQQELAALLGVSAKTIGGWEAGLFAPSPERLEQLIALYVARGGAAGRGGGVEEAEALWEAARRSAARRLRPFDLRWFAALGGEGSATLPAPPPEEWLAGAIAALSAAQAPRPRAWGRGWDCSWCCCGSTGRGTRGTGRRCGGAGGVCTRTMVGAAVRYPAGYMPRSTAPRARSAARCASVTPLRPVMSIRS